MSEDVSTDKEKKLIAILCFGTHKKRIPWRPFDGGYATDISSTSHGFIKIAIQKINTAYCLQIRCDNNVVLDKSYHSFDAIFSTLTELYQMLDKKVDKADELMTDLLNYFSHVEREPPPCPQQNP